MEPLAVDLREAGRLTSLSPRTIRRQIKAGRIRAVMLGRRVLVPISELRSLINSKLEVNQGRGSSSAGRSENGNTSIDSG